MKARQNIRKRINAARRAIQIEREADRKAHLVGELDALLARERRVSPGLTTGGRK